jgi:cytochrome oxidase Cu insertion factor (SCO1/SenC/PrrC family)
MATSLHRVYDGFIWRMETITPTNDDVRQKFVAFDPAKETPSNASGWFRKFYIDWRDSKGDFAATNVVQRESIHYFLITIYYPVVRSEWARMHHIVLQDRHDIIKQLRDDTKRRGYNADNTTTDVGLYQRRRNGDQLIKDDPKLWRLLMEWECKILESES